MKTKTNAPNFKHSNRSLKAQSSIASSGESNVLDSPFSPKRKGRNIINFKS